MIRDIASIRVIDVLYRVSTIAQEQQGDSLANQRRAVEEQWAAPRGIRVRRRIEVTESGKSALRLKGASFEFSRRAQYTDLIVEYQRLRRIELPDAICIDWQDRWNRSPLELLGLIEAFSALGIRMIAIGDELELTDPRQRLVTTIKSAVAGEQLRVTSDKVREAFSARRARGKWQTGRPCDGYRNHAPDCPGMVTIERETADGKTKRFRVRACQCSITVLHRDPAREATIAFIWDRIIRSAGTYEAIAQEVNAAGHRRICGKPYVWEQIYQIALNPHYGGIMASDRFIRDAHDRRILQMRPILDQNLVVSESIPNPYVTPEQYWETWRRRFEGRRQQNVRRGSTNELYGVLVCPECGRNLNGRTERYKTVSRFAICVNKTCRANTHAGFVRLDAFGLDLISSLAKTVQMDDAGIAAAMKLRQPSKSPLALVRERETLLKKIDDTKNTRHVLIADRAAARISQRDYESETFAFRNDLATYEKRVAEIDRELAASQTKPTFEPARSAVAWLAENWAEMSIAGRAEAIRLLVTRVTVTPTGRPKILEWGPAFRRQAVESRAGRAKVV